jgi:hypothetical protein
MKVRDLMRTVESDGWRLAKNEGGVIVNARIQTSQGESRYLDIQGTKFIPIR